MKKLLVSEKSSGRGKLALALLAVSVLLAGGTAIAILVPAGSAGPTWAKLNPLDQAKVAYADRNYVRAEEQLRDLLKTDPNNLEATTLLGRVLCDRGRLHEAQNLFTSILKADANNFEALRGMARVYEGLGQSDLAVVYLQRAAALRKDHPQVWRELGLLLHRKGDALAAFTAIQQSLSLDREQADLSNLISELALGKSPWGDPQSLTAVPSRGLTSAPRPINPADFVPKTGVPDPLKQLPQPPGRTR